MLFTFCQNSINESIKSKKMADESSKDTTPNYWLVFGIGIAYILLLGLFTYFFNYPL